MSLQVALTMLMIAYEELTLSQKGVAIQEMLCFAEIFLFCLVLTYNDAM